MNDEDTGRGSVGIAGPPGRDAEAAVVAGAVERLAAGQGGVLLLAGEGGVGKTTMSAWAVDHARSAGVQTLEAPCFALSAETPYACLVAAFGPVVRAAEADGPSVIRGLASLGLLFDGIDWGVAQPAATDDALARTRLHGALATLVSRLSAEAPMLLVVDDLHWADPSSLEVLHALSSDLPDLPMLIVASLRPFEAGERRETRRLLRAWRPAEWVTTVDVGGLDLRATGELVHRRLGGVVPARIVEVVHQRSGGTPLVAEELIEAMVETGALRPVGRRWELGAVDDVPVMAVADDLIGDRLNRLGGELVWLVATVAVAGEAVTDRDLVSVTELAPDRLRTELDDLRRAGLLDRAEVIGATAWVVHHPIIGEVAVSIVGADAVAAIHLRYAEQLADVGIDRQGRHVLGAGELARDDRHLRVLLAAGRAALDRGAPDQACSLLGAALDALDRCDGGADRTLLVDVLAALGRAWNRRGEFRVALHHLARANDIAEAEDELLRRAELMTELYDSAWNGQDTGIDYVAEFQALLGQLEAAGEWRAAHRLVRSEVTRRSREGERGMVRTLRPALERIETNLDDPECGRWRRQLDAIDDLEHLVDGPRLLAEFDRLHRDALEAGDTALERRVLHERLDVVLLVGSASEITAAVRAERDFGERWSDWPTWRIGVAAWDLAMADGDLERATEIENLLDVTDHTRPIAYVAVGRAVTGLVQGISAQLPDGLTSSSDAVIEQLGVVARWWRGDPDREEIAHELWDGWSRCRYVAGMPIFVPATAALAAAEIGAAPHVAEIVRVLRSFDGGDGRTSAWAAVIDAELASDADARAASYAEAMERFAALERPFDAAVCALAAVEAGGEVAPEQLTDAAHRFDELPTSWLRDRLDVASGGIARSGRSTDGVDDLGLTRREREVAEVVAEGLSNREVANRLFISVRTVTSHLDHIYTKLGIGSRHELTELLHRRAT